MRPSVIVVAMSMLAACGGLAYLHNTRENAASGKPNTAQAPKAPTATASPANLAAAQPEEAAASTETESSRPAQTSIAELIRDTESADPRIRATAIAALADAPKAQALPALERVLETGEPNVDRHIALRSMHSLALRDGDPTGQIRDVMRHAIYHGDDDGVTQTAQSLLDDIEAELSQRD